jgi:hypothetical protein
MKPMKIKLNQRLSTMRKRRGDPMQAAAEMLLRTVKRRVEAILGADGRYQLRCDLNLAVAPQDAEGRTQELNALGAELQGMLDAAMQAVFPAALIGEKAPKNGSHLERPGPTQN